MQTQCWICLVCHDDHSSHIKCQSRIRIGLTAKNLLNEIENTQPRSGCYLPFGSGVYRYEKSHSIYLAFDNSTGDCWVEEFEDINKAFRWLKGEFEIGDTE